MVGDDPQEQEQEQEECPVCKKGAPMWMSTFADMATLLMAFFVLILSFSEIKSLKYKQIAGSMKNAFGVQKEAEAPQPPKGTSLLSQTFSPTVAQITILDQVKQETTNNKQKDLILRTEIKKHDFDIDAEKQKAEIILAEEIANGQVEIIVQDDLLVVQLQGPGSVGEAESDNELGFVTEATVELYAKISDAQKATEAPIKVQEKQSKQDQQDETVYQQQQQQAQQEVAKLQMILSEELTQGLVEVERKGTKIIVRLRQKGTFPNDSAQINPTALPVLRALRDAINRNRGQVIITGHTDDRLPSLGSVYPSNWDLSAVRAAAIADSLISLMNIPKERISVSGKAATAPLNNNASSKDRARNRRVEVVLDIAGVKQ
ncbi:MAG: flagellar motor protein MotB [Pseudomonadales bacterium]